MNIGLFLLPMFSVSHPYIGLSYIKAALIKSGNQVKLYDFNVKTWQHFTDSRSLWEWDDKYEKNWIDNYKEIIYPKIFPFILSLLEKINIEQLDMIGFSVFASNWCFVKDVIEYVKKRNPSVKIIIGGPVLSLPAQIKIYIDYIKSNLIDAVVVGEGEEAVVDLAARCEKSQNFLGIPGVISKDGDGIGFTPFDKPFNANNDLIPDFDDIDLSDYNQQWGSELPFLTSRGCIAKCNFCVDRAFTRKFVMRDPEKVFNELKINSERYNTIGFVSLDLLLNGNYSNFAKLADLIIDNGLKIHWGGSLRIYSRLTYDFLKKLRASGFVFLLFGLESGSERIIKLMKKDIDLKVASRNIRDAASLGITVMTNIVISYPGETEDDFQQTMSFLEQHGEYIASLNISTYKQADNSVLRDLTSLKNLMLYYEGKKELDLLKPREDDDNVAAHKFERINELNRRLMLQKAKKS